MDVPSKHLIQATMQRPAPTKVGLQRVATTSEPINEIAPPIVGNVIQSLGQPLDASTRSFMDPQFGHDFSNVRVHADDRAAASARAVNARAYTVGNHVAFDTGRYRAGDSEGRELLAHELAHVVQQGGSTGSTTTIAPADSEHEVAADRIAKEISIGNAIPSDRPVRSEGIQRRVEFRDVGRGEQSGFARLPDLIARLNAMPGGLTYAVVAGQLTAERREGEELSAFDQQMIDFIGLEAVIPLRLTNREGLLGTHATGFDTPVLEDAWASGYVDIDDLLASSDLGLQSVLVHFIRERAATRNYARRIGSPSLDTNLPGPAAEFTRVHALGNNAELQLLQGFFGDPTIRIVPGAESGNIFRVYRNSRRDLFRTRIRSRRNVDAVSVEVRTPDGRILTPEEYLALLESERIRDQVARERLSGATEHRAGGGSVPAP